VRVHVPGAAGALASRRPVQFYLRDFKGAVDPTLRAGDIIRIKDHAYTKEGYGMRAFMRELLGTVAEGQHSQLPSSFVQARRYSDRLAAYMATTEGSLTMRSIRACAPWTLKTPQAADAGSLYWARLEFVLGSGQVVRLRGVFTIGQTATTMEQRILSPAIGHVHAFAAALLAIQGDAPGSTGGGTINVMFAWCALAGLAAVPAFTAARIIYTAIPCGNTLTNWRDHRLPHPPRKVCSVYFESLATAMAFGWARKRGFVAGFGAAMQASGKGGFTGSISSVPVGDALRELLGVDFSADAQCPPTVHALVVELRKLFPSAAAGGGGSGGGRAPAAAAAAAAAEEGEEDGIVILDEAEAAAVADADADGEGGEEEADGAGELLAGVQSLSVQTLLGALCKLGSHHGGAMAVDISTPAAAIAAAIGLLNAVAGRLQALDTALEQRLAVQQQLIDYAALGVLDAVLTQGTLARLLAHDFSPPPEAPPPPTQAAARALLEALGVKL
jgi:hypothetical protein